MYQRPPKPPPVPRQGQSQAQIRRAKELRAKIVEALELYWTEHDRGPTRQELGAAVGIRGDSLKPHLERLRDDGVITWDSQPRSLRMKH